jgi:hypothetical protein
MKRNLSWLAALALILLVSLAWAGDDKTMVEAEAEAVWNELEQENYQDNWSLWPGTDAFYEGTRPHGALLTTYVNGRALDAINAEAGTMPPGAMVVKENYTPEKKLAAVTVMYKAAAGFDPDHNNWFWLKRLPDGEVAASGEVQSCIGCHSRKAGNDYLFTGDL